MTAERTPTTADAASVDILNREWMLLRLALSKSPPDANVTWATGRARIEAAIPPNIDEDLGGGWHLTDIYRLLQGLPSKKRVWRAGAENGRTVEYGFGDSPSTAYLALRTAIEAKR